jgi:signal peptidase II
MMRRVGLRLALLFVIVTTIGCDRVTKQVAMATLAGAPARSFLADTVRLAYVENAGGFLSLGANLPPLARTGIFTIGTGLMLLLLAGMALRSGSSTWTLMGVSLFVAGGASNWVDRLLRGSVVDFLNLGIGPLRTGIFNVADVAIMLGAAIVVIGELRRGETPVPPPSSLGAASSRDRDAP